MYRPSLFPCPWDKLVTLWLIHQWQNSPTKLRLLCSLNKSCSGNDTESPRHYTILRGSSWSLPHPSLQAKEQQLAMGQRQEEPHSKERGRGSLQQAPAILCHLHMTVHSRGARQQWSLCFQRQDVQLRKIPGKASPNLLSSHSTWLQNTVQLGCFLCQVANFFKCNNLFSGDREKKDLSSVTVASVALTFQEMDRFHEQKMNVRFSTLATTGFAEKHMTFLDSPLRASGWY